MPVTPNPPLTLQASAGQPVVIALTAVPGAGMTWQLPAAPAGCTLTEGDVVHEGGGTVGGPARQQFILTCAQPGEHTLSFDYKRPWEPDVRAVQPVTVKVR